MKNKNLTFKYCVQQFLFWAANCGVYSFAATYLLTKGFNASQIGRILFVGNTFSFLLQPIIANYADRSHKMIIRKLILMLISVCILCFAAVRFISMPIWLFAAVYIVGITSLDMQNPLLNAENVYYSDRNWTVNYGIARGMGAAAYVVASLLMGYIMDDFGADWMPIVSLALLVLYAAVTAGFPRDESPSIRKTEGGQAVSLFGFFSKYRWYCVSLFGILFLALFHVMTENYLIEILGRFGGDSSDVGVALAIATFIETPGMIFFPMIQKKIGSHKVMLTAGVFYCVKAVLFIFARSVMAIYAAQLLQLVTYTFISPVQMYYAKECTSEADMIKGQSVITAVYALGCALGNLTGGELITAFGVPVMLNIGLAATIAGLAVIVLTVPKALKAARQI